MKDIAGLIACRGGSVRIPDKNIKEFVNGKSLLQIKIDQLLKLLPKVYVNSDCDKILTIAEAAGAIPIMRDSYYATSEVSINDVYAEVARLVPHEHILYAHVTSPCIKTSTIAECIDLYNSADAESVCTVQELKKFIWYNGESINYDRSKMPRSQDLPSYHTIAFAINILPKNTLLELKNIVTPNYLPVILNEVEGVDIDNELEWRVAQQLYKL